MMLKIWLLLSVCDGLEICPSVERVESALAVLHVIICYSFDMTDYFSSFICWFSV